MSSSGLHHLCRGAVGELRAFGVSQRLVRRGLTTGCSGRSAARPAAEPERWAACQMRQFCHGNAESRHQ